MSDIFNNELFEAFAAASDNVYIYVCDMRTDVSRWSKASVEYFNLEGEYIENAGAVWEEHIHPEDRALYEEDINGVFSGAKARHQCQYRALNRYGEYVWLECKGSVIKDKEGKPIIFAGLMTRLDGQNKYDNLTGLPTSYELYHYSISDEKGIAVLMGLDGFRKVISNYGYNIGDELLILFSRIMRDSCGPAWRLFRFSGDEFIAIAPTMDRNTVQEFFTKVCRKADTMELANGQKISLSVSGGALLFPDDADSRERLIKRLEHCLEYAKMHHRGSLVFFSEEIVKQHQRSLALRDDLKQCIKNGFKGFEVFFQPFVSPDTRRITGCECLLRWKGEQVKDSYPMEFIKVLEEYGGIREVGFWVMEEAIRQQVAWREKYGELRVSFNVSYQQFLDKEFEGRLDQCLEKYGCNPENIIIELTESCQVDKPQELASLFDRLRGRGFKVALDDFGTAYASLEMLKALHVDYIKVEHSFVRELSEPGHDIDYVIIDNLLAMCRRLGYDSIVEGVENHEVADIVGKMDATLLQGYFFSRPVCRNEFEKLLDQDKAQS
ncbi:MAG: GGDEF and EAL domain-containing protein [Butyrivibrio sp.]|nr:GGDEF and EAL domain-containing protein [Acetatifactor muris]MCM1561359.1 GGDEF and EAL domain-containing protein [Butyrivibrio sp.]